MSNKINLTKKENLAKEIYNAEKNLTPIEPLKTRYSNLKVEDAYEIQRINENKKKDKEVIKGRKIGLTSKSMQEMFNVNEPDYGYFTDQMLSFNPDLNLKSFIQPKIEAELSFLLKKDLEGTAVNYLDVLDSTSFIIPVFEIIDSRIKNWDIEIEDTIADNASCGMIIVGSKYIDIKDIDLLTTGLILKKNGQIFDSAVSSDVMGNPAKAVAWLANKLAKYGQSLKSGQLILSGSLTSAKKIKKGDRWQAIFGGIGDVNACVF
ncbi:MAG: 2-keto-4-pentenoate hydratase [bacterium]